VESNEITIERLPRYVRHRHRKPACVLQARDHEIIRVVSQHRVISSDDLQLLVSGSNQTILRRLQKLFHHGYLDRPRSQRQPGYGGRMVYALGQKGAELLAKESGRRPTADWSEKNRQLGASYLEHALMVSRFQAALRFALQTHGSAAVERWIADGLIRDSVSVEHEASTERIPIAPDAFFTLRLLNEPEGRNCIHAFVEADRGTMTTKRFLLKMHGYWHYWRSGRPEEQFGIKNFLVITVTRTTERSASLCSTTGDIDAPRHRGLRMFLFGSEQKYAAGNSLRILEPIWATPADNDLHSLLE
jgi:hypothetical protein